MHRFSPYKQLLLLTTAMLIAFAGCKPNNRALPAMYPRYLQRDKGPMGTNIAYRLLPGQFNAVVSPASKKMDRIVGQYSYIKNTSYINIGRSLNLDSIQLQQLLMYAEKGNEVFIAAESFDSRLLDTLGINYSYRGYTRQDQLMENTFVKIADTVTYGRKQHGFFFYPMKNAFIHCDSTTTRVLGVNENGQADYLVTNFGKGKFYLHANPTAFSNYFLLTGDNTEYFAQVFSYLNKNARAVYWADTSNFGNRSSDFSALSIFWNNPMLLYALLLFVALMLLYIAFGSKRRRRLIPVLPPNNNDSISFVHTIGNLYLQKKDNRNIALKMMTYFFEHIRNNYFLATGNINTEFIKSLSGKSGVEEKKVEALMEKVQLVNNSEKITDQELFEINNLIYEFYKK